ncbi:hypothetical protein EJ110_NYTH60236 [Nymphaea thermarum]|nr:hypothetical protein EJ110_NYTH60236 [Nymphaea thermarum]
MVRINLHEGKVMGRRALSRRNLEWGVINPEFLGRKSRYAFMGILDLMSKVSAHRETGLRSSKWGRLRGSDQSGAAMAWLIMAIADYSLTNPGLSRPRW